MIQSESEVIRQHFVQPFRFLDRRNVNDTRTLELAQSMTKRCVLDLVVDGANHLEAEIRSGESGDGDVWIVHPQLPDDVALNVSGSGGGEREYWWTSESLGDSAEREIVGAEIVTPLTDAMRFIDNEEGDRTR